MRKVTYKLSFIWREYSFLKTSIIIYKKLSCSGETLYKQMD